MNRNSGLKSFSTIMSPPSKAIVYEQHGSPDSVTRVVILPPVEVRENDVCVKMIAAPINPSDINQIEGVYPVRPPVPTVGGIEGVGQVYTVGSRVKSLSPGDFVIPSPLSSGTWQTYVVKDESMWHKFDKRCPIEYAATITVNPLSALRMLEDFVSLKSGLGADVTKEKLKALGADIVVSESQLNEINFNSHLGNLPESVLGFNCIGGNVASLVVKTLREGGTMVTYSAMSKKPITVSTTSFIFKDLSLRGFWLHRWMHLEKVKECRKMIDYLIGLARDGKLKYETELVPFEDFATALDKAMG